ncbi:MAG: hypothetical protein BHW37_01025 [Firmicutes bacterium CAG:272_52_7]|nr:MAG: hypothetical protein BHW37_01025 [Firmicutes bacterium CAG:272_52_7]
MFCEKCGAQLPDKAVFCEKCGTPVGGQAAGTGTGTPFYPPMPPKKPSALKKFFSVKRNVILTAAAAAALLILITVIAVISAMPKKVYVDKYFDIVYTGCVGYATPSVKWNDDALKKIDKKIFSRKVKPKDDFGLGDLWNSFQENLSLKDCVSVSLDKENAYLKNGDKITVSVKPGFTDFEKLYKIKLAVRHSTVKVSGLKEAVEFNPFEGVSVVFDGYTGFGKAAVNVPSSPVTIGDSRLAAEFTSTADGYSIKIYDSTGENPSTYHLRCTFDRVLSLSNGDVITCTVQDADRLVSVMGVSLSAAEKKVTVGGLSDMLSYDPSNEVSAVFSGFSGYGEAEIKLPGDKTLGSYIIKTEADVSASRLRLYTILCDANGNELIRLHYDADKTKYLAKSPSVSTPPETRLRRTTELLLRKPLRSRYRGLKSLSIRNSPTAFRSRLRDLRATEKSALSLSSARMSTPSESTPSSSPRRLSPVRFSANACFRSLLPMKAEISSLSNTGQAASAISGQTGKR